MAEFDEHATIEEAIDAAARGLVKKTTEADRQVEYYAIAELIEAERRRAASVAAGKDKFGLYFIKCRSSGTG
jgi:hypothetical protein